VAGALGDSDLMWPTDGVVTSGFGLRMHPIFDVERLHAGVDIPAPTGQAVLASADGVVVTAGVRGGYGYAVVIAHTGGLSTLYGHLSDIDVYAGQYVDPLQQIGNVGSTGDSTGPHLHYEIRVNGVPNNPMYWFD
jgi:murein DD-endopeptidase MepM/ murein hydrolase activator NlpD